MGPKFFDHFAERTAEAALSLRPSRRHFLIGSSVVAGGFMIGFGPAHANDLPGFVMPPKATNVAPYIRIGKDNTVTVLAAHLDMGQGIYSGTATLVAEEMGADYAQMRAEGASGNVEHYGNLGWGGFAQGTGGSTGMLSSYLRYRQAGAAARQMLITAAAKQWGVEAATITIEKGVLKSGDKTATFGDLAEAASGMPVPEKVTLKDRKEWTLIGNPDHRRMDTVEKVNGTQQFTIDIKMDGMVTAVPVHPPVFGATVKSFDAAKSKAVKGVVDVVQHPRGLAVVAENMWAALKGREVLSVEWDDSKAMKRSTAEIEAEYRDALKKPAGANARNDGNVDDAFKSAAKVLEANFEFPYLAHAALEPLNAVARFNADGTVEVWGGHQMPDVYQAVTAQIAGVTPDKVKLHVMKTGGGFGRRAVIDADVIVEAVSVAKAVGKPVKMQWTREDDMRAGRYRPAYMHSVKAGIDKDGNLVAWHNHIVGQSIIAGTPFEGGMVKNGVDVTSVEGANNIPYAIPNVKVDLTTMATGVPVLWWRAVGSTHTAYAVESFLDEVAEAAGKDPVEFRMGLLKDKPRHAAVLKLAAEKAGWGTPAPEGRFRGIALAESFNSFVAQVAEISVTNGQMKVEKVTCAVDCGVAVMPDQVKSQIEGGIGFGLGAILKSKLSFDAGKIVEGNFDGYEVLTIAEMPQVEVHIVQSDAYPTGVGEPGVPPIGPAVANALYQATKKRIRVLPFNRAENA
jgi:isoquinoline 1-oxidoreductase subunit beta